MEHLSQALGSRAQELRNLGHSHIAYQRGDLLMVDHGMDHHMAIDREPEDMHSKSTPAYLTNQIKQNK